MHRHKILILTVHHGASHRRVADALQRGLSEIRPDVRVEVADALRHCAGWFRFYYDSYEIPLKVWPALWGWIEGAQHGHSSTGPHWLYRRGARGLFRYLQAADPDVVVATEVGTCELATVCKRQSNPRFQLVGVPTGLDADRAWAQPEVSLYIVPVEDVARELEAAGVPREKILACGQPVGPAFSAVRDRAALRAQLGTEPNVPLLLVLFGGAGYGKPGSITGELRKLSGPIQSVFIAGRNRRLEERIRRAANSLPGSRVLGWVDNVHEWMAAADLLISKPGATTVIEALNCGLPLLALDPLPGNERRACDWIEKRQVGEWVRRPRELASAVSRLLADPHELSHLRRNALSFARPLAAQQAAEAILKLANRAPA